MLGDDHLPSGYVKIAIEHGHRNSGFTHEKNGDFPVRYVSLPEGIHENRDYIIGFPIWDG